MPAAKSAPDLEHSIHSKQTQQRALWIGCIQSLYLTNAKGVWGHRAEKSTSKPG